MCGCCTGLYGSLCIPHTGCCVRQCSRDSVLLLAMALLTFTSIALLLQPSVTTALICTRVSGNMRQIDASNGQVYGVGLNNRGYMWVGGHWISLAETGALAHISVGPAGVWAVGTSQELYRMVEGRWAILAGQLSQVDAGGNQIVAGVDSQHHIFCSNRRAAVSAGNFSGPAYSQLPGSLRYYSCGPRACWGIDASGATLVRLGVRPQRCVGSRWRHVPSNMVVVEVASDGSVYAVDSSGEVFRRAGISHCNPVGTHWKRVHILGRRFRHVTADLGALWLIESNFNVVLCR
ncbi:fish-egg lectin-like [Hypanus sabinus]|uniref:fish-egg lectin-like n=1 Tax=Hypanus sabinus TaxID=79690 RepID=UPI0028C50AAF|nr:fish-egg lectin-like [Hypanus sabinus]